MTNKPKPPSTPRTRANPFITNNPNKNPDTYSRRKSSSAKDASQVKKAKTHKTSKPNYDRLPKHVAEELEALDAALPERIQNIKVAPKLSKDMQVDLGEQVRLDLKVESLYLQGSKNFHDMSRRLEVSYDRIISSFKRVAARWQATGLALKDMELIKGERLASIDQKLERYWILLSATYADLHHSAETVKAGVDPARKGYTMDQQIHLLDSARSVYNRSIYTAERILNAIHKWEESYSEIIGAKVKVTINNYGNNNSTDINIGGESQVLTPDEQVTLDKYDRLFVQKVKGFIESGRLGKRST